MSKLGVRLLELTAEFTAAETAADLRQGYGGVSSHRSRDEIADEYEATLRELLARPLQPE